MNCTRCACDVPESARFCPRCGAPVEPVVPPPPPAVAPEVPSFQPARPTRPAALTVFGVLHLVFGGLGLLCFHFSLLISAAAHLDPRLQMSDAYRQWMFMNTLVSLVWAAAEVALGIALLKVREWGRVGSLIYGWFHIAWTPLASVITFVMVLHGALGPVRRVMPGAILGVLFGLVTLAYPILLVIFMSKSAVKEACRGTPRG